MILDLSTDGAANSAAIMAAFESLRVGGKAHGRITLRGKSAPLASPLDFDLGFHDTTGNPSADTGERFVLFVDGTLTPAPGIGTAIHVHGGYGARIDVAFAGGGAASDVALLVGDLFGPVISCSADNFAGTALKADAHGDTSRRIRLGRVSHLRAQGCGQALYWRSIEAFGTFDFVWDSASLNGSQFIGCADAGIKHWESYTPASQVYGLDFDGCNSFQVDVLTFGDSATGALVRIKGGDFGRINQIRASGRPGIATPTITGVLLEGVSSVNINDVQTFRCAKGIHVKGGGSNGIEVLSHRSLTTDVNPLCIESGAPRLRVNANYRNHQGASVIIGAGLTGGRLNLSGYTEDMWTAGASGKYAVMVDPTAGSFVLDVAGLTQRKRGGLAGFVNHPTPANVLGVAAAHIGNTLTHGTDPAPAGIAAGVVWQNASDRTATLTLVLRCDGSAGILPTASFAMGPTRTPPVVGTVTAPLAAGLPPAQRLEQFEIPPWWWFRVDPGAEVTLASSFTHYA